MEIVLKRIAQSNLFIVDQDEFYGKSLKDSLMKKFGLELNIFVCREVSACFERMEIQKGKLDIVLLNYLENKELSKISDDNTVKYLYKNSPKTAIIVLSTKEHAENARKSLAYGAQDFIIKDQFALKHILSSVQKCLHPAKV